MKPKPLPKRFTLAQVEELLLLREQGAILAALETKAIRELPPRRQAAFERSMEQALAKVSPIPMGDMIEKFWRDAK